MRISEKKLLLFFSCLVTMMFWCCNSKQTENTDNGQIEILDLQALLIEAKEGEIIEIPEGNYAFNQSLSFDGINNVTIKGAGIEKTILSFKDQLAGAEGLKINDADNITLINFTIEDAKGDAIKLQNCNGVHIKNVKTWWREGAKSDNGGYGLYPVSSTGVLIEGCIVSGASDAGIYVGQSMNVIVRNNHVYENVAGIEIENCINSDVYNNLSENNTGGILVFDLPELPQTNGYGTRIYDNMIRNNNHQNFAPEGNMVAIVPPGSGIILLAAKDVEVFDNTIEGHKTIGVAVASYQITQRKYQDSVFNPFSSGIYLHDNVYQRKKAIPDISKDFGKMVNMLFLGKPQDILFDGIINSGSQLQDILCIQEEHDDLRFANVDAANNFDNVRKNIKQHNCEFKKLDRGCKLNSV